MQTINRTITALAFLALTALQSQAQSTYEPYTFTTLAGGGSFTSLDQPGTAPRFLSPHAVALDSAGTLTDLRVPPSNRLEALKGDRKGQHSIRINDQYRICFTWKEDGAHGVEITKHYE